MHKTFRTPLITLFTSGGILFAAAAADSYYDTLGDTRGLLLAGAGTCTASAVIGAIILAGLDRLARHLADEVAANRRAIDEIRSDTCEVREEIGSIRQRLHLDGMLDAYLRGTPTSQPEQPAEPDTPVRAVRITGRRGHIELVTGTTGDTDDIDPSRVRALFQDACQRDAAEGESGHGAAS